MRPLRLLAVLLLAPFAGACDLSPNAAPALPELVDVRVSTPYGYDQALLIAFSRPVHELEAAPGIRLFGTAGAGTSTVLVVADAPLHAGEHRIGTFRARDADEAARVTAAVLDAARSDYEPRDDLSGYAVRLVVRGSP
jgi:hypothetical protein